MNNFYSSKLDLQVFDSTLVRFIRSCGIITLDQLKELLNKLFHKELLQLIAKKHQSLQEYLTDRSPFVLEIAKTKTIWISLRDPWRVTTFLLDQELIKHTHILVDRIEYQKKKEKEKEEEEKFKHKKKLEQEKNKNEEVKQNKIVKEVKGTETKINEEKEKETEIGSEKKQNKKEKEMGKKQEKKEKEKGDKILLPNFDLWRNRKGYRNQKEVIEDLEAFIYLVGPTSLEIIEDFLKRKSKKEWLLQKLTKQWPVFSDFFFQFAYGSIEIENNLYKLTHQRKREIDSLLKIQKMNLWKLKQRKQPIFSQQIYKKKIKQLEKQNSKLGNNGNKNTNKNKKNNINNDQNKNKKSSNNNTKNVQKNNLKKNSNIIESEELTKLRNRLSEVHNQEKLLEILQVKAFQIIEIHENIIERLQTKIINLKNISKLEK
ncbi:finger protein [Anaeramoeba flamelloides]|uniref:Finger protein n=1 Tax=Anaeramoeba flamelloides TaxID=1746091 RepID=A0AAV7ZG25_9EUKA|nr:finger protein [Anaeramoeba flamelloides]